MQTSIIPKEFYLNQDVCHLAKSLLGKILVSSINHQISSGIIVETEAYRGPDDRASHSYNNRRTPRNESMYLEGGHSYVYICYGVHHLFNIVTAPRDVAHAVLIRAIEPIQGVDLMLKRRQLKSLQNNITKGPGALSVALGIDKSHDALPLYNPDSKIQIWNSSIQYTDNDLAKSTRIGVEPAGEAAFNAWRFFVKNSRYVSAHKKSM